ncbi:hypothetical protein Ddc_19087 [Ditylenchus destructor]|nr:hypothetical protein Ddc_19087 [Ditylenchus destructor]
MALNPANVVMCLAKKYLPFLDFPDNSCATNAEEKFSQEFASILNIHGDQYETSVHSELVYLDDPLPNEDLYSADLSFSSDSDDWVPPDEKKAYRCITISQLESALQYYRSSNRLNRHGQGVRTLDSMHHKFYWIQKQSDIDLIIRYEKQKEKQIPRKKASYREIKQQMAERFYVNREQKFARVHEKDIKRWASQINRSLPEPLPKFKPSKHFIDNFKAEEGIGDRITTHIVSKKQVENSIDINAIAHMLMMMHMMSMLLKAALSLCAFFPKASAFRPARPGSMPAMAHVDSHPAVHPSSAL